jgi:hypothetical protein
MGAARMDADYRDAFVATALDDLVRDAQEGPTDVVTIENEPVGQATGPTKISLPVGWICISNPFLASLDLVKGTAASESSSAAG